MNVEKNREIITELADQEITVVFTSKNAVKNVVDLIDEGRKPRWKIFAIDGITMDLAIEHFGKDSISGAAPYANELAPLIAEKITGNKIVFFCGNKRRDLLPETLKR